MHIKHKKILILGMIAGLIFPNVSIAAVPHQESLISIKFPPASGRGAPARTAGGGTRNGDVKCTEGNIPLTALMPTRQNVGITVEANPTFFIYVPKTTAQQGEFIVVDEDGNDVYFGELKLPNHAGIVQINLPASVTLKKGNFHTWMFSLICNPENRNEDEFVQGLIQRRQISINVQKRLQTATKPIEKAQIYAAASIWNETLTNLVPLRNSYPAEWKQLLDSVGLENLVFQPVISSQIK